MFLDIGTGARDMGAHLPHDGTFRGICLLSHLHWDHTQGLPFFTPLHCVGAALEVYAPAQDDGRPVAEVINEVIRPPLFPVAVDLSRTAMVLLVPAGNPKGLRGLEDLTRPGLRLGLANAEQSALGALTARLLRREAIIFGR